MLLFANTHTFWSIFSAIAYQHSRRWDIFWEFSLDGLAIHIHGYTLSYTQRSA